MTLHPSPPTDHPIVDILNIKDGETVHQRFLLVLGRITGPATSQHRTSITVVCQGFPSTQWPCLQHHFKALVHLNSGPNTITFMLDSHTTFSFHVYYLPLLQNPPLSLVILVAHDSPCQFDTPPEKQDENGLEVAIEKLRLAGYLWQSFCAEQMHRHGMGRRTFRLEEAWLPDTVSQAAGYYRHQQANTALVRVLRSQHSLQTLRDARRAQQNPHRDDTLPSLFDLFMQDIQASPDFFANDCLVAGLILDAHWDTQQQLVVGHAALGGGVGNIRLGIFGSHALHAFPRSIEHIVPAMLDTTLTDTRYVANDANESSTWWKALNIGMGAMLHEVGHAFTLSHTPSGLMARGFNHWNRTFMIHEPGRPGIIVTPEDEEGSKWHRVDILRLRYHPAFRLPLDPDVSVPGASAGPRFDALSRDQIQISSPTGITLVELWVNGHYVDHYEYLVDHQHHHLLPTQLVFSLQQLEQKAHCHHPDVLKLEVTSPRQHTEVLENTAQFLHDSIVRLPGVPQDVIQGKGLGQQGLGGANQPTSKVIFLGQPLVTGIRVYSGSFLDGVEFFFANGTTALLGKRGGHANQIWSLAPNERVTGLTVRCGAWVDGLALITNQRQSPWYGGQGGGMMSAMPPSGYQLVGFYASAGAWMDQIGIYYIPL
ncbi:putative peptidase family-domain-containing protein [Halteromyces radiatus]|uniref:putative peptidase family-domain-containing protein n=1 Tax=Halteromyces radiatus TaxID=101107 RepID=UPI00221E5E72|nr:putative peptidase family-domain-containing protein [Halteromyces radiatus]KAI8078891.1 putative peptidase family-domain-containing protein [Halteromyces radiatus]